MSLSPFHGIFSFGDEAAQAVESSAPESPPSFQRTGAQSRSGVGQIAVDIYEQDNYYIVRAPIAGVKLSDLDIEVDGKILTIRGRRDLPEAVAGDQYYLQECFWGEFSRSITLPCMIDPKRVKATFTKDCILKILIPKEEKVKIVRINEG